MPEPPHGTKLFSQFAKIFINLFSIGEFSQNSVTNPHQCLLGIKTSSDMLEARTLFDTNSWESFVALKRVEK